MRSVIFCCMLIDICLLCFPYLISCRNDHQYEICKKVTFCGNQTIQFPFYTEESIKECGFPGFQLSCINNYLLLNISEDSQYRISKIFYQNNTLHAANVFSLRSGFCNLSNIRNLSLPSNGPFEIYNHSSVLLLSNCDQKSAQKYSKYNVSCDPTNNDEENLVLAMNENDSEVSSASKACPNVVAVPIGNYSKDNNNDYLKLMRSGFDLRWAAPSCSDCQRSGGFCGYEGDPVNVFKCFCSDKPHSRSCKNKSETRQPVIIGTGTLAAVLITAVLLYCFWSKCLSKAQRKDLIKVEAFLKLHGNLAPKRFRYQDIKKMTHNLKYKLGQGGYGSVYKGKLADDRAVAVKILNNSKSDGEEFLNEVASISRTSHVNIVSLLGFCFEDSKRALVYEFMPNGSLEKFISRGKSSTGKQLEWQTLINIALGIARGLEYLHRGCTTRILHFDIKPHNILLDEEFCPKISDFGLSKLCLGKDSIISLQDMRGTPGYIAPEVYSRNFGGVSHKSDVYSYGMMILEMAGAKDDINEEANNCSSEKYFPDWIYDRLELNADQVRLDDILNEVEYANTRKMMIVGLWCIQTHPSSRPSMTRVLNMFEQNVESLQIPPKPFLQSSFQESAETFSTTQS